MRTIKNRVLTLLLAGLMAGQAILPVSAAEPADVTQSAEDTEAGIMLIDEVGTDATETAEDAATTETVVDNVPNDLVEIEDADEASTEDAPNEEIMLLADEVEAYSSSGGEIEIKTYSVDPFDAEYSAGYLCISDSVGSGLNADGSRLYGSNRTRSDDIYIDHHEGACISGVLYDIREYTWADNGVYTIDQDGTNRPASSGASSTSVHREFHFYKAGTLDTADPDEVTFRGILQLDDNDAEEGYSFDQGLMGIWLNNPTYVTRRNSTTWKGTQNTADNDINSADWAKATIWAEVVGTPEKPLMITYMPPGGRDSAVNFHGKKITYKVIEDGKSALPENATTCVEVQCATYANYNLISLDDYDYYEFDGWYKDEEMTTKAEATVMVSTDLTFYGTYHKVAGRIDTEVVGGTITEAVDYIDYGEDMTIEYAPNDGYFLDTVTVDGEQVDPDQFKDNYLFQDIQNDHQIKVVYVKAEEPVKTVANADGKNVDNTFIANGDTVTYSISVKNPASTTKTFTITDTLPADMEFVSADHDGKNTNDTITWTLQLKGDSEETVNVQAKAAKAGVKYENSATIKVGNVEITSNEVTTWTVADPIKSVKDVDGNDVDGEFLVNGETVTYIIAVKNPADDTRAFTITDKIPANMEFISADHDGKVANGVITWTIELNGGAEETVRFQAKAMKAGVHYVNSADVTVEDIKTTTNETSNWVMEDPVKVVEMDGKDAADAIVEYNDELTYTITAKNPADKSVKATITDELPDGVTFVTANHGGQESNGTVTWEITMESKETVEFSVVVRVQKISQSKTITNKASVFVNGSTYETNEVENTIRPYKEPETTETHKTINNETENNKVVNNTTINNTTENNAVKNDTEATPAETTTVTGYRNVNTGDMARTGLLVAISTAVAIGLGIYYYRKRR